MIRQARTGHPQGFPRSAWLAAADPSPAGRHSRTRPTRRHLRQSAGLTGLTVLLAGVGGVLLAAWLGLTGSQMLALAHKASGVVALHAAGVLAMLLGRRALARRAWAGLRRVSALLMAAGAWMAVGLGTWSGYPGYLTSPATPESPVTPRVWLLTHQPAWDHLMTLKVLIGWLAPVALTAVAVVVVRHPGLLTQDSGLLRLVRILLTVGLGAATVAAVVGVGLNAATPTGGVR